MVLSSVHLRLFVTTAAVVVLTAGLTFSNIMVSSHLRNPQLTGGAEPSGHISDIPVATAASSTHQLVSSMSRWPLKATDPEGTQAQALAAPATPQFVSFVNRTVVKDRLFVLSNVMLSDNELTIWGDGVLAAACSAWGDLVSACASGHGSASNYDLLNGTYWMMQASLHGDRNNPVPLKIKWQHEQPRCDVYFTESEPVVVLSPRHAPNAWHTMHETVLPLLDTLLHDSVQGLMMPTLESNNHRTEHHDIHHVPTEFNIELFIHAFALKHRA